MLGVCLIHASLIKDKVFNGAEVSRYIRMFTLSE